MSFASRVLYRYCLLFVLSLGDYLVTNKVISGNVATEANPLMMYAIQHHGLESILFFKVISLLALAVVLLACRFGKYKWVIGAMDGLIISQAVAPGIGIWIFAHV